MYARYVLNVPLRTVKLCRTCTQVACQTQIHASDYNYLDHDYQYMQRSKVPTMHFQKSLPRLPIPPLEKTCERFLKAAQPLLTQAEYQHTQQVVADFKEKSGKQLNDLLKRHDKLNKHTSYISAPWFDMYLRDRVPLPINYNPLLVMRPDGRDEYQSQLVRTVNVIISSLRFWRSLRDNLLEPEVYHLNPKKSDTEVYRKRMRLAPQFMATYVSYAFKAYPLDMSQYNQLFGTSRIPELDKDRLVLNPNSKHIIVMRRGNIYALDVLDDNGHIEPAKVILSRLKALEVLDESKTPASTPLGILTAAERNEWAKIRQHFITNQLNEELLSQKLDNALFCICLDTKDDPVCNENDLVPLVKHLLVGKATNRWFDKSVTIIMSADGTASVNFEHSWGDGVAVLRYFNEIYKETLRKPFLKQDDLQSLSLTTTDTSKVRYLNFEIDDKMQSYVQHVQSKHNSILNRLNMSVLRYPDINKVTCKRDSLSPDSIMQLAFQLAYKLSFDKYVGTYESCSTAAFKHGRTETMRPCTNFTKHFCESLLKGNIPSKELRNILSECSKYHGQLTKEAAMGQGFDRHLFALKHMALTYNITIPDFYNCEAYKLLNYNIVSTSTLSSDALLAGSFGPVVPDGLGIAYSIQNDYCGAIVTSYQDGCNGAKFTKHLEEAFNNIRKIIDESKS